MNKDIIQLGAEEKIIKVVHRSWFYLAQQFFILVLIASLFFAAVIFVPLFFPDAFGFEFKKVILFFENTFEIALWIYGFLIWIEYYLDIWIITTERVINVEQNGLFRRRISELSYAKIEDVSAQVEGLLPSLINYGDVLVQTAAEVEKFDFKQVQDPYHLKQLIMAQMQSREHQGIEELGEILEEKINQK